jgi:hypothetical protein
MTIIASIMKKETLAPAPGSRNAIYQASEDEVVAAPKERLPHRRRGIPRKTDPRRTPTTVPN